MELRITQKYAFFEKNIINHEKDPHRFKKDRKYNTTY